MPTIEKANETFSVLYQPDSTSVTVTAPVTIRENFIVNYIPTTSFTSGGIFYEFFSVFTWMPVIINICEQLYREIFRITWTKYVETEFAEFNRYELHRNVGGFTPVPGGPTLLYQTTDANILEYFDTTPDENGNWFYSVLCILDDGRYCVSASVDANHYPRWGAEWPDVIISNNGQDDVPQSSLYECECTIATDPEGATPIYRFQYCQSFSEPQGNWVFVFGSNPAPRFVDCGDKRVVIYQPSGWGVNVAGELWTKAGNRLSDLLGYGPSDKVYIYDEELNFIVFGDNTNGKTPGFTDAIQINYSSWINIITADSLELNIQTWDVGELSVGADYKMRVFPMDNIAGKRGYSDISETTFRLIPELAVPVLVYPENLTTDVNTYWPHFQLYGISAFGGSLQYEIQCSDVPDFSSVLRSFSGITTPAEWSRNKYSSGEMVYFTPPYSKPVISPLNKRGPYYWRARSYDVDWDMWSKWCTPFRYNVEGATFHWRIGLSGDEKRFIPAKDGWNVETVQIGREKTEKHIFRCTLAPMTEQQFEILKAEFNRRSQLSLWDNMGENYTVYWGECERSLNGHAFFPDTPALGISQKNYIPGSLRYWGECVFTEV